VQVLQHEQRRRATQLRQQRHRHFVGPGTALDHALQLTAGLPSDVQERPKRAWGEQRIAAAPQHSMRALLLGADGARQRRLADACLTRE
jgi:hypothetical protein